MPNEYKIKRVKKNSETRNGRQNEHKGDFNESPNEIDNEKNKQFENAT